MSHDGIVRATKSALAENLFYVDGKKFSFENYPFTRAIYDGHYVRLLKMTARQIGKSCRINSYILTHTNQYVEAKDVRVGDRLLSFNAHTQRVEPETVTWVSTVYTKDTLRVQTRTNLVMEVGDTHPVRTWDGWTPAGQLKPGDRVAILRKGGIFTGTASPPLERIRLTAYIIGDGYINHNALGFTSVPGNKLDEFHRDVLAIGDTYRVRPTKSKALQTHVRVGKLKAWLAEDALLGHTSYTKFLPAWVFNLSEQDTALFLNRLWSTDGHVKKCKTNYDISYASCSTTLIKQVQALLWKFGIPSNYRRKWPSIYKRRGERKYAYELRVLTKAGVENFLTRVGALDKSEQVPLPDKKSNNNMDTLPQEGLQKLISAIVESGGPKRWNDSLYDSGLSVTLAYAPTRERVHEFVRFFRARTRYDQRLVDTLEAHVTSDIIWDTVESIEPLGAQDCVDFTVENNHSFIIGGVVTHNSTLASNFMLSESVAQPHFKTLYVAPSREQAARFSSTRLSKTMMYSPIVRKRFFGAGTVDNVFQKIFTNGAEITLSYATDDPDRIRGITADRVFLDEVQDLDINSVLPIVKECAASSEYGYETYAGTAKSTENGIQYLWQQSTQTEWLMKCAGCGKHNFIDSHKSMGTNGPICVKCGHAINPRTGFWYSMNPGARIHGFHISQPMLPLNSENPARWERLIDKLETYSPSKFKNEVLGVSDSIGTRMLSLEELESACDPNFRIVYPGPPANHLKYRIICGGVDWSGGGSKAESRTVCWVWGLMPDDKLKMLYYRIFPGRNQVEDVREVADVFQTYRCQLVCGDAGEGAVANAMLKERLGENRVYQLQYGSHAKQIAWNGKDRFIIDKTAFIDTFMLLLKRKGCEFSNVKEMQVAFKDILAEFEEVTQNGMGRKVWKHSPTQPDDSLHAALFGWVAMRIARGELQLYKTTGIPTDV